MVARNIKIVFVKPQIIKLKNLGKSYSEIVSNINSINGDNYQVSETVHIWKLLKLNILITNFLIINSISNRLSIGIKYFILDYSIFNNLGDVKLQMLFQTLFMMLPLDRKDLYQHTNYNSKFSICSMLWSQWKH